MSIQTSTSAAILKRPANKYYVLAFTVMGASLMAGLSMTSMSAQAASLGELFSNSNNKSKFLPVDKAFQVVSSTKATSKGTQLSINFDITPGYYVYKNKLTLSFPKGVSASPFNFSQSPVSIDDPTFGKVPVFTQRNMVATTMLTTNNGKGAKNVPVVIGWQGCATAGLCYPPEKVKTTVDIAVR
ncbi:protein-disulfide reductase DsbD N-terminal domain-containing protein [Psychrobacter sp. NZS113]|uniref:protein-disulfide reductase DsbD N-terminal domain-containing protein n=1 Tax=Psychrobacter sp. NZS113 TaxID=2792045 RepID=UPI0018CF53E3|nr:protein-disulfide reductase DsbD N-terminal domain-containing protein [Psychrobacter sp. NZS113]MBH0095147.1 protein-disulfide reductase DsbD N-terminal domain-containing protein [Psychrobacter sp. NZS113]